MSKFYHIRPDYQSRAKPQYFVDGTGAVVWQPDVYSDAARLARTLGTRRIVDVGCGSGDKLAALAPEFDIVGVDYGSNIADCRRSWPIGQWFEQDLDKPHALPFGRELTKDSLVICSDVIEHVTHPEYLLKTLSLLLVDATALLISTPDRQLWAGHRHLGPPRNQCHVREWSLREFDWLLDSIGMRHRSIGLTRSNDRTEEMNTMLALVTQDRATLERLVPVLIQRPPVVPNTHWLKARCIKAARILLRG